MATMALRVRPTSTNDESVSSQSAQRVMRGFYWGEACKLGLVVLMFTAALTAFGLRAGYLFAGYLITTLGYWLLLLKV